MYNPGTMPCDHRLFDQLSQPRSVRATITKEATVAFTPRFPPRHDDGV